MFEPGRGVVGTAESRAHGISRPRWSRFAIETASASHYLHRAFHMGMEACLRRKQDRDDIEMWDTFDYELSSQIAHLS